MRYILSAMLILLLAGCADAYYPGYAHSGYATYPYAAYPAYGTYPTYAAPTYSPGSPAAYSPDNCGTPYQWRACSSVRYR